MCDERLVIAHHIVVAIALLCPYGKVGMALQRIRDRTVQQRLVNLGRGAHIQDKAGQPILPVHVGKTGKHPLALIQYGVNLFACRHSFSLDPTAHRALSFCSVCIIAKANAR